MTSIKLPKLLAVCCHCWDTEREASCFPPEEIGWHPVRKTWLCRECWDEDAVLDEDLFVSPLVVAKDALEDKVDMERRLIAAATARRLGV